MQHKKALYFNSLFNFFWSTHIARRALHVTEHRTESYATFPRIDATFFSEFRKLSR